MAVENLHHPQADVSVPKVATKVSGSSSRIRTRINAADLEAEVERRLVAVSALCEIQIAVQVHGRHVPLLEPKTLRLAPVQM